MDQRDSDRRCNDRGDPPSILNALFDECYGRPTIADAGHVQDEVRQDIRRCAEVRRDGPRQGMCNRHQQTRGQNSERGGDREDVEGEARDGCTTEVKQQHGHCTERCCQGDHHRRRDIADGAGHFANRIIRAAKESAEEDDRADCRE